MKDEIAALTAELKSRATTIDTPRDILKDPDLKKIYAILKTAPSDQKAELGKHINALKQELEDIIYKREQQKADSRVLSLIDVTAPMDINAKPPELLPSSGGTIHPLMREIAVLSDIFQRMGFAIEESREIDNQFNMFEALNFPKGHPARDDYDTFMTVETDEHDDRLIAPAHTSTMQNRIYKKYKPLLDDDQPIAVVVPDRVFRNEDVDARHEHTFYQFEGIYVDKGVHAGMLVTTLQEFLQEYYQKKLEVRINPYYFPFTEPSFEFMMSCPFCQKQGCKVCSHEGWIEILGCGMIHPNVLSAGGIDPTVYTGFAWGGGVDRLVMMKQNIEDIRHFHSAKLDFLRQF